ncbi:MAG TPA: transposase [Polyangiaceae bacterium]
MRRRYTARQREQLIEAVRTSGEPVGAAAKRLGVTASTAYHWMKAARRAAAQPQFARLVPSSSLVRPSLVVRVRGAAIRVEGGFDAELLRAVVWALSGRVA